MKNNAQRRALALIAVGLVGIGAYQMILRLSHPTMMENDFFHGLWFGVCIGLEITGLYILTKNKRG